jgi:hypothetical protein
MVSKLMGNVTLSTCPILGGRALFSGEVYVNLKTKKKQKTKNTK